MEQFVELMLATDRKAREMIDKARQAKAQAVADAQKQAEEICAADEKRLAAGKAQVDAALAEEKQAQAKAVQGGNTVTLIDGQRLVELIEKYQLHITPRKTYTLDDYYFQKD